MAKKKAGKRGATRGGATRSGGAANPPDAGSWSPGQGDIEIVDGDTAEAIWAGVRNTCRFEKVGVFFFQDENGAMFQRTVRPG